MVLYAFKGKGLRAPKIVQQSRVLSWQSYGDGLRILPGAGGVVLWPSRCPPSSALRLVPGASCLVRLSFGCCWLTSEPAPSRRRPGRASSLSCVACSSWSSRWRSASSWLVGASVAPGSFLRFTLDFVDLLVVSVFFLAVLPARRDLWHVVLGICRKYFSILVGSLGVFIALRSSRSRRLLRGGAGLPPGRSVEEGQQRQCPPAVGACRPLGLGCGRRRAPPRDSDAHHPHARKGSVSPHAPQHTHRERCTRAHSCVARTRATQPHA